MDQLSNLNKIWITFLVINLLVLNGAVGWLFYKNTQSIIEKEIPAVSETLTTNDRTIYVDKCGDDCQKYIDDKISQIDFPTPLPTQKIIPPKTVAKTKTRNVSYVTIPGNGNTTKNDWIDIAGTDFYFNPADYPGLLEIYFESNMKLFNGNGMAYVRLYDVTHGIGVQGGDVQTSSQTSSLITSGKVSFWSGKNQIRVQAKSLTADTVVFDSGRLRIVTEN